MLMRPVALGLFVALAAPFMGLPARAADPPFIIPSISSMTGAGAFSGKETEETLRRLETASTGKAASKAVRSTSRFTTIRVSLRSPFSC